MLSYNKAESPTVVDIGAGSGDDLTLIKAALPKANLNAIECFPRNIEKLRDLGVNVFEINLERDELPFANESVDLVIANQIFEHCKELFFMMHEISRVLKVGGVLYVGVPNLAALHSRILLLFGQQPSSIKTNSAHIRGFTISDFRKFLDSCFPGGYEICEVKGSNFYPFPEPIARFLSYIFPSLAVSIFFTLRKRTIYQDEFITYPIGLETNFWLGSNEV